MLIDDLLAPEYKNAVCAQAKAASMAYDWLKHATVIKVQNVCDYYEQHSFTPSGEPVIWDMGKDFPNVAPPMPAIWMEWKFHRLAGMRVGVLLVSCEYDKPEDALESQVELRKVWDGDLPMTYQAKWGTLAMVFCDFYEENPKFLGHLFWLIKGDGSYDFGTGTCFPSPSDSMRELFGPEAGPQMMRLLHVAYLSLSFLHCKNVALTQCPPFSAKHQKSRVAKGKLPLLRFHTLSIEPVKKIIRDANGGSEALSPKSLHLCRGHFKTFSEHKLFGKFEGTFWWPMHVRGNASAGIIRKNYDIKAPV